MNVNIHLSAHAHCAVSGYTRPLAEGGRYTVVYI